MALATPAVESQHHGMEAPSKGHATQVPIVEPGDGGGEAGRGQGASPPKKIDIVLFFVSLAVALALAGLALVMHATPEDTGCPGYGESFPIWYDVMIPVAGVLWLGSLVLGPVMLYRAFWWLYRHPAGEPIPQPAFKSVVFLLAGVVACGVGVALLTHAVIVTGQCPS